MILLYLSFQSWSVYVHRIQRRVIQLSHKTALLNLANIEYHQQLGEEGVTVWQSATGDLVRLDARSIGVERDDPNQILTIFSQFRQHAVCRDYVKILFTFFVLRTVIVHLGQSSQQSVGSISNCKSKLLPHLLSKIQWRRCLLTHLLYIFE